MGSAEKHIDYENIRIKCPYELKQLTELKIIRKLNDHSSVFFSGMIPEDKKESYIEMAKPTDRIEVTELSGGSPRVLFKGVVSNVGIRLVRGIYYIEVEGLSNTFDLDVVLKARSFQNKSMTYGSMIKKVLGDYAGADCQDTASNGAQLKEFIVQYNETDWQFLLRMASRLNSVLVPDISSDKPKFWFGIPKGKQVSIPDETAYSVRKEISRYLDISGSASGVKEQDFTSFKVESRSCFDLGDKVSYKGKSLVITCSKAHLVNGSMKFTYSLSPENGIKQAPIVNHFISGAAIEGKIIAVEKDNVKVHLVIDKEQSTGEACWFRYTTSYTAEGNSGWYCMPQKGDSVRLSFLNGSEDSAVVVSSVRKGGQSHPKTADPGIKYLGTNKGKEMKMGPKDFVLSAKENAMHIKLEDDKGITIESDKNIVIYSEKDIKLDVTKNINIAAKESICIVWQEDKSMITMDGETNIKANSKVYVEGSLKSPMSLGDVFNMVKDTVMMPVEMVQGVASMACVINDARKQGKLGETAVAVASNLPVVAGVNKVSDMAQGKESSDQTSHGQGKLGIRRANL